MLVACESGFADCDGVEENGCEVDASTDASNCGTCGTACAYSCQSAECFASLDVALGAAFSCAAWSDGATKCWGWNQFGQLGNGAYGLGADEATPVSVVGLTSVVRVATGGRYACALRTDGSVWCWGMSALSMAPEPASPVDGVANAVEVRVGTGYGCARLSSGTVKCWGGNHWGELGDGTTDSSSSAVSVSGMSDAVQLSLGIAHSCALRPDQTVWCWGYNYYGQLGDGTWGEGVGKLTPVPVVNLSSVTHIAAGGYYSCVRKSDASLWCWGHHKAGLVADGPPYDGTDKCYPSEVPEMTGALDVAAGRNHTCARMLDGAVRCWGVQPLGDGTTGWYLEPSQAVEVTGLLAPVQVTLGDVHSCARKNDGTLWCWGSNHKGQVGNGTGTAALVPVLVLP